MPLLIAALGITLVSLTDTIATSASFAARRGDEVDADQEMVGIGAANIAAGFFQGFAISTSGSRTAVAEQSGAKSQLTGLVGAGLVAVLLLFLNSLLADLPQTALAAVVIVAALSLMDFKVLAGVWSVRRSAVVISLVASAGVILLGVLQGIVVAVVLAILLFFRRNWWPHGEVLGDDRRRRGVAQPRPVPGRPAGPGRRRLPLGGAAVLRQRRASSASRSASSSATASHAGSSCSARRSPTSTSPPPTMLEQLDDELNAAGVHLAFAELRDRLQDLVAPLRAARDPRPRPLLPDARHRHRRGRAGGPSRPRWH